MCRPACHSENGAPCGSAQTAIRPASKTSNGSESTLPPASCTARTVSSALSTATYVLHTAVGGAPADCELIPATSRPSRRAAK